MHSAIWIISELEEELIKLNNVTKFHKILIKTFRFREQTMFLMVNFDKQRTLTPEGMVRYGSILLNIHEVWPRPFRRGSSHQKKNTVDHFMGHIPVASFEGDKRPDKINQKSRGFEHFMP